MRIIPVTALALALAAGGCAGPLYPVRERFGVGFDYHFSRRSFIEYNYHALGEFGWFYDWTPGEAQIPAHDRQFVPLVGGYQCRAAAPSEIRDIVAARPERYPDGTVWLVGNEIAYDDRRGAEDYAVQYYSFYRQIKAANPAWRVGVGAFITSDTLGGSSTWSVLKEARRYYREVLHARDPSLYPHPELPIDVYNIHPYIAGRSPTDVAEFKKTIRQFRQWMHDEGERDKELWITEMGVLSPSVPRSEVMGFMHDAFSFLAGAAGDTEVFDPDIGLARDENRLVQRWAWFVANVTDDGPHGGTADKWRQTALLDAFGRPTLLGEAFAAFVNSLE